MTAELVKQLFDNATWVSSGFFDVKFADSKRNRRRIAIDRAFSDISDEVEGDFATTETVMAFIVGAIDERLAA